MALAATLVVAVLVDTVGSQGLRDAIHSAADVFTVVLTVATVLGLATAIYAGVIAKAQIEASVDLARNDLALRIDARFREDEDHQEVYKALRGTGAAFPKDEHLDKGEDWRKVRNYLRVFERINRMRNDGIFDDKLIVEYYGARLEQLRKNQKIAEKIEQENQPPWPQVKDLLTILNSQSHS